MSAMAGPSQPSSSFGSGSKVLPTYEFTKRKRWADLLLTELVEDITFVLAATGKVLFCGTAVTELLGWKDVELLDYNFIDLVDVIDQTRFRAAFNESLVTNAEFNILLRLRSSSTTASSYEQSQTPQFVLFDMKCYPQTIREGDIGTTVFFGMAAPYPSRNTAMLDTILDLKVENDRLQRKVAEYRARLPPEALPSAQALSSQGGSIYATTSLHSQRHVSGGNMPKAEPPNPYLPQSMLGGGMDDLSNPMDYGSLLYGSSSGNAEDLIEEGSKKKKIKRSHNADQYVCVTCGRTDSPEWRKGPTGPKTLCNACGLRWAKQVRKTDEPSADGGGTPFNGQELL